jgi:hypothetical protein
MRKKIIHLLESTMIVAILLILSPGYSQVQKEAIIIEGKVIAESTGKPVSNAHVFIVDGEEETLTNNNGEFRIRSWQKAPVKLTVEKPDQYQRTTIVIPDPSRKQVVRLKNKT